MRNIILSAAVVLAAAVLPAGMSYGVPVGVGGPGQGSGGGGNGSKTAGGLTVYPDWKSVPDKFGGAQQARIKFNGPGTGVAIGFKTARETGSYSWVETTSPSVGNCRYKAWYSVKPGGAAVSGARCLLGDTSNYGGIIDWTTVKKAPTRTPCLLKADNSYFFNIKLKPGAQSCAQYLVQNF